MAAAAVVHCCLNAAPTPSPVPPALSLPKPALSPWPATAAASRKETCWRGRCVSTVACVIMGTAVGLAEVGGVEERVAYAAAEDGTPAAALAPRSARWSEVRECPPWHANSLENIVPENLPRPSVRRRPEVVGMSRSAPDVARAPARYGCYSL